MENQGSLSKRGRTLEDEFFHRVDQKLADEIREKMNAESEKKELEKTCGFHDSQLLDDIVQLGVNTETIVGLSLVPLVRVAWADGIVDTRERAAVLKAAEESDCHAGSASYQLLSVWLDATPPPSLFEAWKEYVSALRESMSAEAYERLRDNLVKRAHDVATSAGGILGIGSISETEKAVLEEVKAAFG